MEDGAHRERINCLISLISVVRYGASAGRQALERGGKGDKEMGIEKEKESRGSGQQMNLHLCSEANGDGGKKTS